MFSKQCIQVLACAVAGLLASPESARAVWSLPNDCGCDQPSPTSWTQPCTEPSASTWFWMRPAPPYNSSWARVPVTNYRPQVVNDPLSGVSMTALQPCNTFEYQPQRTAGCSLWQGLVDWWRCSCLGDRSVPTYATTCTPTSEWSASSSAPAPTPYYVPANSVPANSTTPNNGRLVPVPSNVTPTLPAPADRRPELSPIPARSSGGNSALRVVPLDTEIFVRTLDDADIFLELTPPLIAPGTHDADLDSHETLQSEPELLETPPSDSKPAASKQVLELLPVSWSQRTVSEAQKLPIDEVWDDTGWHSEQ